MKRAIAIILTLIFISGALTGCYKTPDSLIVVGKGNGQLEQDILENANAVQPSDIPSDGTEIQTAFSNENCTINISVNAEMIRHDAETFPAVKVLPQPFSQAQADKIISVLSDGALLYGSVISKEAIEKKLLEYKRLAQTTNDGRYDQIITDLEKQYDAAPDSSQLEVSTTFSKEAAASPAYSGGILVNFDRNTQRYAIQIQNNDTGKLSYATMRAVGSFNYYITASAPNENYPVDIPYDEAKAQAERTVANMAPDLTLHNAYIACVDSEEANKYAYQFVFTRAVNGFSMVYDETNAIGSNFSEESGTDLYQEPWPYEYLLLVIDKNGMQKMEWNSPLRVEKTLNENVALMPYADIMDVFKKMVFIKNSVWETEPLNDAVKSISVAIDRITLGLSRVQSGESFYLIPVWDFYGNVTYLDGDGNDAFGKKLDDGARYRDSLRSLLTINAIDGTLIDRQLGY